jgi:hypothetical protein
VLTAVNMKNVALLGVTPRSLVNRSKPSKHSAVACYANSNSSIASLRSVRRLLVRANVVPSSPILVILTLEVLSSSEP